MTSRAVPGRPVAPKPKKKTWLYISLGFLGTSLLAFLIVLGVAQSKYEAVFRAPRVKHEAFSTGNTALKIVVKPPLAQQRIAKLLLPNQNLPDWVLGMTMPEETALLFDPDLNASALKLRLFINYARLGPVLRDAINQAGITTGMSGVTWAPPQIVEKQRGVLLLEGSAPLSPEIAQGIATQWVGAQDYPPPTIEGTHVFEAALENRNGKGYAALIGLAELNGPADPSLQSVLNPKSLFLVGTLHAYLDFTGPDNAKLVLVIDANPSAGEAAGKQIKTFLDLGMGLAASNLRRKYAAELTGTSTLNGMTVRGEYDIKGVNALLAQLQAAG
jgi:hypothetical protein